jgi:hypothetical protein
LAGALVYCELWGKITHTWTTADANGFYSFSGNLADGGGVWRLAGALPPHWYEPTAITIQAGGSAEETC